MPAGVLSKSQGGADTQNHSPVALWDRSNENFVHWKRWWSEPTPASIGFCLGSRAGVDPDPLHKSGEDESLIFNETKLKGAFVLELERREDERGFFARAFCQKEFIDHSLKPVIAQGNIAFNKRKGTVRGMHFQFPPKAETKLVRATRGAILDIIVDLRPESPTYLQHLAVELSADNHRALYVPERFAHGYQTLEDATETSYQVGEFYAPGTEGGLSPFDPRLKLDWPLEVTVISPKDAAWKSLDEVEHEIHRKMMA